jgi:CHRD domain
MIKRIAAAVAVSTVVVSGAVSAQAAQGTQATRLSTTESIMLQGSLAHGTAVLTYSTFSRQTKVVLRVTGLSKGVHLAHIHVGASCMSNGSIKYPLNSLRSMGVRSIATSTTIIRRPRFNDPLIYPPLHKQLYINVHGTTRSVLKVVACGALM